MLCIRSISTLYPVMESIDWVPVHRPCTTLAVLTPGANVSLHMTLDTVLFVTFYWNFHVQQWVHVSKNTVLPHKLLNVEGLLRRPSRAFCETPRYKEGTYTAPHAASESRSCVFSTRPRPAYPSYHMIHSPWVFITLRSRPLSDLSDLSGFSIRCSA